MRLHLQWHGRTHGRITRSRVCITVFTKEKHINGRSMFSTILMHKQTMDGGGHSLCCIVRHTVSTTSCPGGWRGRPPCSECKNMSSAPSFPGPSSLPNPKTMPNINTSTLPCIPIDSRVLIAIALAAHIRVLHVVAPQLHMLVFPDKQQRQVWFGSSAISSDQYAFDTLPWHQSFLSMSPLLPLASHQQIVVHAPSSKQHAHPCHRIHFL